MWTKFSRRPLLLSTPDRKCLGSVLFLIYIDDVCNNILSAYYDRIYLSLHDPSSDRRILQRSPDAFVTWSNSWQLNVSPEKCHVVYGNSRCECFFRFLSTANGFPKSALNFIDGCSVPIFLKICRKPSNVSFMLCSKNALSTTERPSLLIASQH